MSENQTEKRKKEHINICLEKNIETTKTTGFEDINLIHKALPNINMDEINTSCTFLNKPLNAPIIIEAMTGGAKIAEKINKNLAIAAKNLGLAMGVGSQRAAIENNKLISTYNIRDVAPNIPLIGNLGAIQFAKNEYTIKEAKKAITDINADALAIHLNPLQEVTQPEGDLDFKNVIPAIKNICQNLNKPVIAKETGAGISREIAQILEKTGVSIIDVAGLGGTSFSIIESYRDNDKKRPKGHIFEDWGITTAVSIIETRKTTKIQIIASGGIRTGIDAAKSIALGANYVGLALPLLEPAAKSAKDVENVLKKIIDEFKTAM
ncbi:MAG: type 2 isopentenyl-diphosphate Delta-isomerase, partial [Candidatus Aenigmarchaeota archaeon]|nr:type 2 isopentenyl-diphosphate Delta-isomerase [Candidatus Aenigmarchaeota archaeon]